MYAPRVKPSSPLCRTGKRMIESSLLKCYNHPMKNVLTAILKKHRLLLLLILTNLVFLILYRRFLFGDAVFMYSDVGSDSLSSSYPIITMLSRLLHNGDFSFFTLSDGLGGSTTATFLQYLNPIKFFLLLFGRDGFPAGILIFLLIQYNLTAVFSWFCFRLLLKNENAALFSALIWSFSGYIVTWGQNYSFGTCMLLFTAVMFFLQHCLDTPAKKWRLLLTGCYALFLISNYYFFYMTGFFSVLYTVLYLLFRKKGIRTVLSEIGKLALTAAGAAALACVALIPILASFLGSARTSDVTASASGSLPAVNGARTLLTFLGRLFSTDTMGTGSAFTGDANYYETAFLFTSSLFLFAFFYLLFRKKSRRMTLLLLLLSAVMLVLPLTSRLLCFNFISQRWTFMLCFAQAAAIGFFLRSLMEEPDRHSLMASLIAVPVFCVISLAVLFLLRKKFGYALDKHSLMISALFIGVYFVLFLLLYLQKKSGTAALLLTAAAGLLCAELIVSNQASLYSRNYLTRYEFSSGWYNDGTETAVNSLNASDSSLYRISASTVLNRANEGLVDGYNSTSSYSNTTAASQKSLTDALGIYQKSSNFFVAGYPQYYLFTFLSGKYLISSEGNPLNTSMETSLFSQKETIDRNTVYENNNALPFGYLYTKEIAKNDFLSLDVMDRMHALTRGFFYTDGKNDGNEYPAADTADADTEQDLAAYLAGTNDCTAETVNGRFTVTPTGNDPYIILDASSMKGGTDAVQYLRITQDTASGPDEVTLELFTETDAYPAFDPSFSRLMTLNHSYPDLCQLLPDGVRRIRIDFPTGTPVALSKLALVTSTSASSDFSTLAATDISGISFAHDTYRASVTSHSSDGMLCIPLLYTKNWTASVSGNAVSVENINGGLCGIRVPAGTSEVTMTYHIPGFSAGVIVSCLSAAVFLFLCFYRRRKSAAG